MNQVHFDKLNQLDFLSKDEFKMSVSDKRKVKWDEKYEKLKQFKEENGHCAVHRNYINDAALGSWVNHQRECYRKGNMSQERLDKLNQLDFFNKKSLEGNFCETREVYWGKKYEKLKQFKEEHGHCCVPKNYINDAYLSQWTAFQRMVYKKGNMSHERLDKLNQLDFLNKDEFKRSVFEKRELKWDEKYEELKQFIQKNGHCSVPQNYINDISFGRWINTQRECYRKGNINQKRFDKLNQLGFFNKENFKRSHSESREVRWEKKYEQLKKFKREHGHCRVPRNYINDISLNIWINNQRRSYKKGTMDQVRFDKLNKLGFF